ncbi:MAG: hypothetical protein K1X74_20560 [Pirellulales bacterium]|nr:hypothetical protein [Pirellulales bacterium]
MRLAVDIRAARLASVAVALACFGPIAAAAEEAAAKPPALDPVRRTYIVMALFGLALIGALMVVFVAWGGRLVRRHAQKRFPPTPLHQDDWYRKPLVPQTDEPPADS